MKNSNFEAEIREESFSNIMVLYIKLGRYGGWHGMQLPNNSLKALKTLYSVVGKKIKELEE